MPCRWEILSVQAAETDAYQPLGRIQSVGQLEHIITEHVEIGLCVWDASRKSGEYHHARAGLLGQQLGNLLAQLNFRDHDPNPFYIDLRDETVKLEC